MVKETLLKIYNQFTQVDANRISLVTYDPNWNYFQFVQDNRTTILTSASTLIIPTNNLKYAALTPNGYADLMTKLQSLIADNLVNDENTWLVPTVLGFDVYQAKTSRLFMYPVKISSIKVCDITNKLVIKIMYSFMYKKFNNPLRAYLQKLRDRKRTNNQ